MEFINSIILGIVQGVTEFLPISSSGHLVVAHDVLGLDFIDNLSFDVALHVGTLVALLFFFWNDIIKYIVAFAKSFANWDLKNNLDQRLAWFIFIGSIPAGVFGFAFESVIDEKLRSPWLVAVLLIAVGLLFLLFERLFAKTKELESMGLKGALVIGFAQVLALMPGVSRSGITILAGLAQGLKRQAAARFSFLLSIPVVFGAGLKKMLDVAQEQLPANEWLVLLVGALSSAVVGFYVIKYLLKYLSSHSLNIFAYYRFVLGAVIIVYLLVR
jgi:undecaprenyl-diphosphatase